MIDTTPIQIYTDGQLVYLLNPQNFRWVKMSKMTYDSQSKDPERFYRILNQRFQLMEPETRQFEIKSIYYSVTNKCNMRCPFCALGCSPDVDTKNDMTLDDLRDVILPKLSGENIKKIVITGGEPTIRDDIIDIAALFSKTFGKSSIILQTNGLLLTEVFLASISENIGLIEISVEYIFKSVHTLEHMKEVFRICREKNIYVQLSFVVDRYTRKYMERALDLCDEFGCYVAFRIVSPVGNAVGSELLLERDEVFEVYIRMISYILEKGYSGENIENIFDFGLKPQNFCGAYGSMLTLRPDGGLSMCANLSGDKFSLGNLMEDSMDEVKENLAGKLRKEDIQRVFLLENHPACRKCEVRYFCPGPCAAELGSWDDESGGNGACELSRAFLRYKLFCYKKEGGFVENLDGLRGYLKGCKKRLN